MQYAEIGDVVLFRNMTRDTDFICDVQWAEDIQDIMAFCRDRGFRYNINEHSIIVNYTSAETEINELNEL